MVDAEPEAGEAVVEVERGGRGGEDPRGRQRVGAATDNAGPVGGIEACGCWSTDWPGCWPRAEVGLEAHKFCVRRVTCTRLLA